MKRFLRPFLSLLIIAGIGVALWPLGQIAYARWNQDALRAQWQSAAKQSPKKSLINQKSQKPSTQEKGAVKSSAKRAANKRAAAKRAVVKRAAEWPPTRLIIPDIDLDAVVVQGFDEAALARGPGHEPYSALPGQPGNCAIAAHRNVYGAWFYKVDQLWPGSAITLRTPQEDFNYQVISVQTTVDSDVSVLRPPPANEPPRLTLLTCTIPRSANRIVVVAQLVEPPASY